MLSTRFACHSQAILRRTHIKDQHTMGQQQPPARCNTCISQTSTTLRKSKFSLSTTPSLVCKTTAHLRYHVAYCVRVYEAIEKTFLWSKMSPLGLAETWMAIKQVIPVSRTSSSGSVPNVMRLLLGVCITTRRILGCPLCRCSTILRHQY